MMSKAIKDKDLQDVPNTSITPIVVGQERSLFLGHTSNYLSRPFGMKSGCASHKYGVAEFIQRAQRCDLDNSRKGQTRTQSRFRLCSLSLFSRSNSLLSV